jgi:hypothetical protein
MEAWPSTLPVPNLSGYALKKQKAFTRTDRQTGLARQRRTSRVVPLHVNAAWRFTPSEFTIFKTWHKEAIFDGAAWFTAELNIGFGMQTYTTRFVDDPDEKALPGMNWEVSATLEVIDV